jgi:hypothetical protein
MQQRRQRLTRAAEAFRRKLPPSRIIVAGGPRSGKTTFSFALSRGYQIPVHGTDELRALEWSESSRVAATWFDRAGPWICEGVVVPRALRKWLAANPEGAPADFLIWVNAPVSERVRGQEAMAKGCATVFDEILIPLRERGMRVLMP